MPGTPAQILIPDQPGPNLFDRNGKRFAIHSFRFVGNTAFSTQRLKRVVERYRDLELNLYQLNDAADAITEFYRDQGYTLARAVVPPQKVEDGVITLAIVEGRLGKVVFTGNKHYSEVTLRKHVPNLQPGELVTTERLERSLLLLNDMPGLKVRATLSPGAAFGTSDVLVKTEEKLIDFNLTVDNAGREETGRYRANAGVNFNNLLGIGDQVSLSGLATSQGLLRYKKFGYSVPLNDDGLRVAANYSDVTYDVAGTFAALGISGRAATSELAFTYPLQRSRGDNRMVSLAYRNIITWQETLGVNSPATRLPLLVAGYQTSHIGDDASVTTTFWQASTNFTRNSTGLRQDAELFRGEFDGTYLLPLNRRWDVYLRGNTVWSHDRLPDSEKMSIGGPGSVRGYRSSEVRGDSGYQGTLEFRRNFSVISRPAYASVFYDAGRAIYKMPGFSDSWDDLQDGGVGITVYPVGQSVARVEVSRAIGGYQASDQARTRVWFSFGTSF
jgi:hemolysin activation/secretion protein